MAFAVFGDNCNCLSKALGRLGEMVDDGMAAQPCLSPCTYSFQGEMIHESLRELPCPIAPEETT